MFAMIRDLPNLALMAWTKALLRRFFDLDFAGMTTSPLFQKSRILGIASWESVEIVESVR